MTLSADVPTHWRPDSPWIGPVPERLRERAAALLSTPDRSKATPETGRRMLDAAAAHGVSLDNLWVSLTPDGRDVGHVCLLSPGAGRVAMVFLSAASDEAGEAESAEVVDAACLAARGPHLAQALLEVGDERAASALRRARFQETGRLLYLKRPWRRIEEAEGDWPEGVEVRGWGVGDDPLLVEALRRTYEGTLDCPELCGLRDEADIVASHRATGRFDPSLWWIILLRGEAHGALLLNPCPAQGHTELVYIGLSPALRGLGLGDRLLRFALSRLSSRSDRDVMCAVDARNEPARAMYERLGFAPIASRVALIRSLRVSG
jgi:mycothiol synthase